jgi:hypothetical protein
MAIVEGELVVVNAAEQVVVNVQEVCRPSEEVA